MPAGFKGLGSVRLLAASADALALLRFDMEVQHARAPNNSALPGAALRGPPLRSMVCPRQVRQVRMRTL